MTTAQRFWLGAGLLAVLCFLYLVRESATDEGSPREASPFWDEVQSLFPREEVERATSRRRMSELTWRLEDAPTERERSQWYFQRYVTHLPAAGEIVLFDRSW